MRTRDNGERVEAVRMTTRDVVVLRRDEAYSYYNITDQDLVIHDTTLPAFREGDDVNLNVSLIPDEVPVLERGFAACVVKGRDGEERTVRLPERYFDLLGDLAIDA